MKSVLRRLRHGRITPLEGELLAARPQPPERLVESIVAMVRPRSGARPARLRLAFAGALTVALVAVAGATGGFSYAASAIAHATRAVHVTSAKPSPAPLAAVSSACSQYAVAPIITGIAPTSGKVGTSVVITGDNFSGDSAITSVTFSGAASASFTINSDTQLTTTVPVTAHTGVITVSNCVGSATSGTFTLLPTSTDQCKNNGWKVFGSSRTRATASATSLPAARTRPAGNRALEQRRGRIPRVGLSAFSCSRLGQCSATSPDTAASNPMDEGGLPAAHGNQPDCRTALGLRNRPAVGE